ncbi:class I adenylate-forming enzyme family protein [Amycolatopsis sp. NPDC098790]|uniref:class I adenylate-forming enzyme family protein n=1 Tax=Amycolatopsis sp. NPDC098790 TaxID=3363939 RepID=UPI003827BBF6
MTQLPVNLAAHQQALLGKTMPDALDAAAATWPDNLALHEIEGEQRSLTWGELRSVVTRVRSGLEAAGLRPGDKVGVITRNQLEFPISWLAIVEAGAAIVPLNPKYTEREMEFVLGDAGATWLVGTQDLIELHAADGRVGPVGLDRVVAIGESELAELSYEKLLTSTPTPRRTEIDPLEVTNIQFTSGTTGLPKGCLLTHEYWMELGIYGAILDQEAVRLLADHPFYYMQNQAYFMLAIVRGAALYVTPGLSRRKFMDWLHDYRIDFAWIDEGMLEFPEDPRDKSLSLKRAPVSGLPSAAYAQLEERFGIAARECYASTEVGSGTAIPFDRGDLAGNGSMGFCFPNRESKVIDENLEEVPPGTPGELCFRGSGMMLGYHGRPEVNAELFLPGGWFRTGDVVVKEADGQHYFRGRLRDMIRRNGENISAAEVEMHLGAMPGVDDVAAVPVPDPDRDEEVKVIVVPEDGVELTAAQVVEWAREGLAPFKVPRYVEFRAELPYTASGKIHKAALKDEPEPLHAGVVDTRP